MALDTFKTDESFCTITWSIADLVDALEGAGYEANDENISKLLEGGVSRTLKDNSIEIGWGIIYILIDFVLGNNDSNEL